MKKSRTGPAILFIVFLAVGFIIIAAGLAIILNTNEESTGLSEIFEAGNRVGVVQLEGTIVTSDTILKQLRKLRKKSSVKAIVIRINSPGGTVAPAQEIYREIVKTKRKKPVVASMETVGASAAYYVASSANTVVCSQGTITGSIGVIMMLPQIRKIIEKIGVDVNVIKAGKYKDIGSAVRPLTEDERNILQTFAKEIHEQFISDVAAGRKGKIDRDKLVAIADGRFFTGEKAKELGLVDEIGNFYDAVKIAGKLGGIKGEPELVYPKKKWDSYLDLFMDSCANTINKIGDRMRLMPMTPSVQ
jgi:protease-4